MHVILFHFTELFKVVFVNEIWMYDSQLMFCQCCLEGRWLQALEQIGVWLQSCEYIFVLRLSFLTKWDSITFSFPGLFAYLNGMRIAISIKNDEVKAFSLWKVKRTLPVLRNKNRIYGTIINHSYVFIHLVQQKMTFYILAAFTDFCMVVEVMRHWQIL